LGFPKNQGDAAIIAKALKTFTLRNDRGNLAGGRTGGVIPARLKNYLYKYSASFV
jgi:hypothetical protein